MTHKKVRLSEESIDIIKKSTLRSVTLSNIIGCSVSTVDYYRNRGIWSKKGRNKL